MNTLKVTIQHRRQDEVGWPVDVEFIRDHELPIRRQAQLRLPENYEKTLLATSIDARGQGEFLGQALFVDGARDLFTAAYDQAAASAGDVLHVQLTVEAAELQGLRWERLCAPDGQDGWDFLAMDQRAPFSFHLSSSSPRSFPPLGRIDLRALVVVASPPKDNNWNLEWFDANEAADSVRAALDGIPCDLLGSMADAVGPATLEALCGQLTKGQGDADLPYTLLHVVAHGKVVDGQPLLYLLDKDGKVKAVQANALIQQLKKVNHCPHLAFLSACESAKSDGAMGGLARQMVELLGLPAVVAMTEPVSVVTASELAKSFYLRLKDHGLPDLALTQACASLQERHDILTGTLWSRLEGKPLFDDRLDCPLSAAAVENGLDRMEKLLPDWAPVLMQEFVEAAKVLRGLPRHSNEALSSTARKERDRALADLDSLCREVLDLSFPALALDASLVGKPPENPFLGLGAFRNEERRWFFGRERESRAFCDRLAEHDFLVVLGDSGSGKTSLIQAGMMPLLEERAREEGKTFHAAVMTPGANPEAALSSQLEQFPQTGSVLLVVDQMEELFLLRADKETQRRFFDRLLTLRQERSDLRLLLAIRTGFKDQMDFHADFGRLFEADHELLRPMNASELQEALQQQAMKAGMRFAQGLDVLVRQEAEGLFGTMALLQHLLSKLWERRHGRWLPVEEWEEIGGMAEAFVQAADSACAKASESGSEDLLRSLLVRLVRLDKDGAEDGCQPQLLLDLLPAAGDHEQVVRSLIWQLVDERLLVSSADQQIGQLEIRLASDKLINVWPRLKKWLHEDREVLGLLQEQIRDAAREWRRDGRLDEDLPRKGDQLLQAEGLLRMARFAPNVLETEFLDAARSLAEKELREKEEKELEIRHNLGLALNEKAAGAESKGSRLRARLYSLHALLRLRKDSDAWRQAVLRAWGNPVVLPVLSCSLAGLGSAAAFSPDGLLLAAAAGSFVSILDARNGRLVLDISLESTVLSVAFSPDGRLLAAGASNGSVALWNAVDGEMLCALDEHNDKTCAVAFSPDGRLLASGSLDKKVVLWNIAEGKLLKILLHDRSVLGLAFSPDGQILASGACDNRVHLWNVPRETEDASLPAKEFGQIPPTFVDRHSRPVSSVAFSPDGRLMATGSRDDSAALWDVASGRRIRTLEGHADDVLSVVFSPDGRLLASASKNQSAVLWDVQSGEPIYVLDGHKDDVCAAAFSPDGQALATVSQDGIAAIWNVRTAEGRTQNVMGHANPVHGVAFSPDGRTLATASGDKTAAVWDASTGRLLQCLVGHEDGVHKVAFSPDGRTVATSSWDGTIGLWDAREQLPRLLKLTHSKGLLAYDVAFSPDGRLLASASEDGTAALWDVGTGQLLKMLPHARSVLGVAFSPDGRTLATASEDGTVVLWETLEGRPLMPSLKAHEKKAYKAYAIAFSPDGCLLASASEDGTAALWDVGTGRQLMTLKGHGASVRDVAFSSDGLTLATASEDGTVVLWETLTGQRLQILRTRKSKVLSVAFSPAGGLLAFGDTSNAFSLWNFQGDSGLSSEFSLESDGSLRPDHDGLGYRLEGIELVQVARDRKGMASGKWDRRHPFHWLDRAEAGNAEAMLEIALIHDRSNDIARALRWYQKAMAAGSQRAKEQQDRLLHWLESEENRKTVPAPMLLALCAAREELGLSGSLPFAACERATP